MKTIAVTIDLPTLRALDRYRVRSHRRSRSECVRLALQAFISTARRGESEERERQIVERHYELLNRQAAALIEDQAKL